jgi:hypothetical protein
VPASPRTGSLHRVPYPVTPFRSARPPNPLPAALTSVEPGEIEHMAAPAEGDEDPAPAGEADADPASGVLGNLPRSRPSVRSPRRDAQPPPRAARAEPAERAAAPADEGAPEGGDLESLARGGIAIAGGAASLGLRIAGRAAAAVRDAVERR